MSLTKLFLLMGFVSSLLIAGIIYNKIGGASYVTYSEVRSIDRLCQRDVEKMLETFAKEAQGNETLYFKLFKDCLKECRDYLIESRLKKINQTQGEVFKQSSPQCLDKNRLPLEYQQYYFKDTRSK
jgi:hypothetical protein